MSTSGDRSTAAVYMQTGELIREARKKLGLTQTALAAAVGLTRTSVVNIEGGKQKMLLHTLFDIAHALDVEPPELLPKIKTLQFADEVDRLVSPHHGEDVKRFLREALTVTESYRDNKE